jgi:hypothetical protein
VATDIAWCCSESFSYLCVHSRRLLLNVSESELEYVDAEINAMADDGVVLERAVHGNTGYEPVNSMPVKVQRAVRLHIRMYTSTSLKK